MENIEKALKDGLEAVSAEFKEESRKNTEKIKADVAQMNEDATKSITMSLGELKERVDAYVAKQGKLFAASEAQLSFKDQVKAAIGDNFEGIQKTSNASPFRFELKAVGDMTPSANLTGNGQATYSGVPSLRGRRKVAFRNIPGVEVVPSDTGIWKYYLNNTPAGEGSFGNQTVGAAKAQLDYDFTETTVTVNTLAGFARVAKQMMRDLKFLQNFIPGELQEDYLRSESNSFINSLMAGTSAYTVVATVYAEKLIETIAKVMERDYEATAVVTTALNWGTLLTTKPSDYSIPGGLTITPMGDVAVAGVPVVVQNNITTGKTFVGDFSKVKIIQCGGLAIETATQDSDNFTKNLVTFRAEQDVALAVLRSDWGCYF